jgi:hypothetical protein
MFKTGSNIFTGPKYGLVELDLEVETYDFTLNEMPASEVKKWADRVIKQLREVANLENDRLYSWQGRGIENTWSHIFPNM